MYQRGKVTAVVQDHVERLPLRERRERLLDTPDILLLGLALPSVDGDAGRGDGGGGVVLGGEDVAGGPGDVGTERGEGLDEDGGLDGPAGGTRRIGESERGVGVIESQLPSCLPRRLGSDTHVPTNPRHPSHTDPYPRTHDSESPRPPPALLPGELPSTHSHMKTPRDLRPTQWLLL